MPSYLSERPDRHATGWRGPPALHDKRIPMQLDLLDQYAAGPKLIREAVTGMTAAELDARPIPGKWSTRQVIAHLADFEPVYADRMKRVIAQPEPMFFGGGADQFAAALAYAERDVEEELAIIEHIRSQMVRILRALPESVLERRGTHSDDGPMTLRTLLERITGHIPHHIRTIEEKRAALRK